MSKRRGVAQFGSALALGARCRRFESCLPDAAKSQSPADVLTAPEGAVFYWFRAGVRKTCVKSLVRNHFCARLIWAPPDSWTTADNV